MKFVRLLTFFLIILLIPDISYSQDEPVRADLVLLREVLSDIRDSTGITFSYLDGLVEHKKIGAPEGLKNLSEALSFLSRQSKLHFEQINDAYIIISEFSGKEKVNVCGFLRDEKGLPVEGAVLRSVNDEMGVVTDADGFFSVQETAFGATFLIAHVAFERQIVTVKELYTTGCSVIVMQDRVTPFDQIVIKGFLANGIDKVNQKILIDPQELNLLPGLIEPDILQSIQQLPGVNNPYETASGIYVRGSTPDQNLVRWNGIKTYNPSHFFGMLSSFNPYVVDEVEFVKNGSSASHGERIAGIIDIKSRDEVPEELEGGAGFNMLFSDAFIDLPVVKDKLSIQLSGRRSFNDLVETPTYHQYADRVFQNTRIEDVGALSEGEGSNNFYFLDNSAQLLYKPDEKHQISINSFYSKNDLEFITELNNDELRDDLTSENEGYSFQWTHITDKLKWNLQTNFSNYAFSYAFSSLENDTSRINRKLNFINDLGVSGNISYQFTPQSSITSGFQWLKNNVRYSFEDLTPNYRLTLDEDDLQLNTNALFAEYSLASSKVQITAGIRYNHYRQLNERFFEPRLNLNYEFIKNLKLNLSAEYRTQPISQIQESVASELSLENQVWTLSSSDRFPIIKSPQVAGGLSFSNGGWIATMEAYYKEIDDITTLTFGYLNPITNDYLVGSSTIRGLDLFLKKDFKSYRTWFSYSYLFAQNQFITLNGGNPFPGNWNIEHAINWSHIYNWKRLSFSLGWRWHSGKAYTEVESVSEGTGPVQVEFDELNSSNLPVYHRLDFSVLYTLDNINTGRAKYRLGISILNLYDRANLINREYRLTPALNNGLIDTRVYSLGITPNLTFRVFW